MRILMCTDGSSLADRAIRFGAPLARAAGSDVTVLGIAGYPDLEAQVQASMARAQSLFPARAEEKRRSGRVANEILAEAESGRYDLIVMSSRGRRGWQRLAFGSVAARLARYAPIPVLIVKGEREAVRRILAATSGDVRGERVARWGGLLARWLDAELTVLHVMSQMALSSEAKLDELYETAEEAIARNTREGRHLARELELARAQGAMTKTQPKLHHGLVLDEIVAEVEGGDYDLLVIGGHEAPAMLEGWSGLRAYLLEDVADQILMAVNRPVLVVKGD